MMTKAEEEFVCSRCRGIETARVKTTAALDRVRESLATRGTHVSAVGRVISRLGRPEKYSPTVKAAVKELATEKGITPGEISRRLAAKGIVVHRTTVRDWIKAVTP